MEGLTVLPDVEEICSKLRMLLENAVKNNLADGILLSGGLDTNILAVIASRLISLKAVTVAFKNAPAPDIGYAFLIAKRLGLRHTVHIFDEFELYDAIPVVVKATRSFDPMEIRNSVPIYIGLKTAKENGSCTVMTGDGCDELFAGYSFLFDLEKEKLDLELKKLWSVMTFSSTTLAKVLEMDARLPYLDSRFRNFAMSLESRYKVQTESEQTYGKWILRKAYEENLPAEVAWRTKMPIECGSGTTILPKLFSQKISDTEFSNKKKTYLAEDGVIIRDKEHLYYYEVYRSVIGVPRPTDINSKVCPQCGCSIPRDGTYCRTCGAYPI